MRVDITRGEATEKELDTLIRRRHERRVLSEGERAAEELWRESERKYAARRREENRVAWCAYYRGIAGTLHARAEEYISRAEKLENGHHENGHKKGDAA
jgi:predicted acetyltransferase